MPVTTPPRDSTDGSDAQSSQQTQGSGATATAGDVFVPASSSSFRRRSASLASNSDSESIAELERIFGAPDTSFGESLSNEGQEDLFGRSGSQVSNPRDAKSPERPAEDVGSGSQLRPRSVTPGARELLSQARQAVLGEAGDQPRASLVMENGSVAFVRIPEAGQRLLAAHGIVHQPARRASQTMSAALERGGYRVSSPPMTREDLQRALYSVGPRAAQGAVPDDALARTADDIESDWRKMDAGGAASEESSWEQVRKDFLRNPYVLDGEQVSPLSRAAFPRVPGSSDDEHNARWEEHRDERWQAFRARVEALPDDFRRLVLAGAHQGSILIVGNAPSYGRDGIGRGVLHEEGAFILSDPTNSDPRNKEETSFRIESGATTGHPPAVHISYTRNIDRVTVNSAENPDLEGMAQATSKSSHYHADLQISLQPPGEGREGAGRVAVDGQHRVEIAYPTHGARLLDAIGNALVAHDAARDPEAVQQAVLEAVQAYARYCGQQADEHDRAVERVDADAAVRQQRALHEQAIADLARHHACPASVASAPLIAALGVLNGTQLNELAYVQDLQAHDFLQRPEEFTAVVNALSQASGYAVANQLNEVAMSARESPLASADAPPLDALRAAESVDSVHPIISQRLVELGLPVRQDGMADWTGDLTGLDPAPPLHLQVAAGVKLGDVAPLQEWTLEIKRTLDVDAAQREPDPDALAKYLLDDNRDGVPRLRALLGDARYAYRSGVATSLPPALAQMALAEVHGHVLRHTADATVIARAQRALFVGADLLLPDDHAWQAARETQAHLTARSLYYIDGDRASLRRTTGEVRTHISTLREATAASPAQAELLGVLPRLGRLRDVAGTLPSSPPPVAIGDAPRAEMVRIMNDCANATIGVVGARAVGVSPEREPQPPVYHVVEQEPAAFCQAVASFTQAIRDGCTSGTGEYVSARAEDAVNVAECCADECREGVASSPRLHHATIEQRGTIQGVISWRDTSAGPYVEAVATHPVARGAFAEVLQYLLDHPGIAASGARVFLTPSPAAEQAYARHGFVSSDHDGLDCMELDPATSPLWRRSSAGRWQPVHGTGAQRDGASFAGAGSVITAQVREDGGSVSLAELDALMGARPEPGLLVPAGSSEAPPSGLRGGGGDAARLATTTCSGDAQERPGPSTDTDRDDPGSAASLPVASAAAGSPHPGYGSLSEGSPGASPANSGVGGEPAGDQLGSEQARTLLLDLSSWTEKRSDPMKVAAASRLLVEIDKMTFDWRAPILLDAEVVSKLTGLAVHESLTPLPSRGSNGRLVAELVALSLQDTFGEALAKGRQDDVVRAVTNGGADSALSCVARWRGLGEMAPLVWPLLVDLPSDAGLGDRLRNAQVVPDAAGAVPLRSVMPDPSRLPPRGRPMTQADLLNRIEAHALGVTVRHDGGGWQDRAGCQDTVDFLGKTISRDAYASLQKEGRDRARQLSARNHDLAVASSAHKKAHQESLLAGQVARMEKQIHERTALTQKHTQALATWNGQQMALANHRQLQRDIADRTRCEKAALPPSRPVPRQAIAAAPDGPARGRAVAASRMSSQALAEAGTGQPPARAMRPLQVPLGSQQRGNTLVVPADMQVHGQTLPGEIQVELAARAPVLVIPEPPLPPQWRDAVTNEVVQLRPSPGTLAPDAAPPPARPLIPAGAVRQHRDGVSIGFSDGRVPKAVAVFPAESFHSMRFQYGDGYIAFTHEPPGRALSGESPGLSRG